MTALPVTPRTLNTDRPLSRLQVGAYSLAVAPLVFGQMPLNFVIPYYAQVLGMNLAMLGFLMVLGRVFDGLADMVVAYVSDSFPTPFGRRRPWVVLGMALFLPAVWLLFVPFHGMSMIRYGVGVFLFFLTWTMAFIPYLSQGTELSTDHHQRSQINLSQSVVMLVALFTGFVAPFLLVDKRTFPLRRAVGTWISGHHIPGAALIGRSLQAAPITGAASYGGTMMVTVVATSAVGVVALLGYIFFVPDRSAAAGHHKGSAMAAVRNPVFQRFCGGYALIMVGYLGRTGLIAFLLAFWFHRADILLLLLMTQIGVSILITPAWSFLFKRLERGTCVAIAAFTECVALLLLGLGPRDSEALLIVAYVIIGLPGQTLVMAPYLVAADCADYASWKNRSESRAIHVSIVSVIVKLGSLSAAASVVMAGLLGFDPKLAVQPLATIHLLKALGLFIPFACLLAGGVIVMTHPITRRRQTAIQRRLDRRLGAAAAAGALVGATGVEAAISQDPLGHGLGDAAAAL